MRLWHDRFAPNLGASFAAVVVKLLGAGNDLALRRQSVDKRPKLISFFVAELSSFVFYRPEFDRVDLNPARQRWCSLMAVAAVVFEKKNRAAFSASASWAVLEGVSLRSVVVYTKTGVSFAGSIHLPCSRIKSCNRSTASASGILNFTAVLPT
jgi:hypothetical protein